MSIFKDKAFFAQLRAVYQRLKIHFPSIRESVLVVLSMTEIFLRIHLPHSNVKTRRQESVIIVQLGATLGKVFTEIEIRSDSAVFYNVAVSKDGRMVAIAILRAVDVDKDYGDLSILLMEFTPPDRTIFVEYDGRPIVDDSYGVPRIGKAALEIRGVVNERAGVTVSGGTVDIDIAEKTGLTYDIIIGAMRGI